MKIPTIAASALMLMSSLSAASADNMQVENTLSSRPELSDFYRALMDTGVNHELNPDASYTVFAPTNGAFARMRDQQYPCFATAACQAQTAQIIRNHIFPGHVYIADAARQRGGVFSISRRFVNVGEPSQDDYTVDGNNIIYMSSFGGGILYKIDGVIAKPRELATLQYDVYTPPEKITGVTTKTIPDPACGPGGCADARTETTTVTQTVVSPVTVPAPLLAPASGSQSDW